MLISFIIPMYNVEKYICETIESIINHKEFEYEIILVNDGSKDKTGDVCAKYVDGCIVKYYEIENHGVSYARNYGMKQAKGKYIMFVDGDDTLKGDFFAKIDKLMECNLNFDCYAFGISFLYYNSKDVYEEKRVVERPFTVLSKHDFFERFNELFVHNYLTTSCNKIYSREFILKNNISFDTSLDMFEDLVFSLDVVLNNAKFYVCEESFYEYHHRNINSLSVKYKLDFYKKFKKIFCKLNEIIAVYSLSQSDRNEIYKLFIHLTYKYIFNELIKEQQDNENTIKKIVSDKYIRENVSKYNGFKPKYCVLKYLVLFKCDRIIRRIIKFMK